MPSAGRWGGCRPAGGASERTALTPPPPPLGCSTSIHRDGQQCRCWHAAPVSGTLQSLTRPSSLRLLICPRPAPTARAHSPIKPSASSMPTPTACATLAHQALLTLTQLRVAPPSHVLAPCLAEPGLRVPCLACPGHARFYWSDPVKIQQCRSSQDLTIQIQSRSDNADPVKI